MRRGIAAAAVAQLTVVGLAVAPQLSARLTGTDHQMQVRLVDPIDPFRGAYVRLDYPGLQAPGGSQPPVIDGSKHDEVFVPLVEQGGVWVAADWRASRPDEGPYLACAHRDRAIRCGIESYFAPQDAAWELERQLARDGGVATIRIDSRGRASVVAVG